MGTKSTKRSALSVTSDLGEQVTAASGEKLGTIAE